MKRMTEDFSKMLTTAYSETFDRCKTKEEIEKLDEISNGYADKYRELVESKREDLENNKELEEAKTNSQKQAQLRTAKLKALISGEKTKE